MNAEMVSILLVDDRPDNLKALAALLARPDYELVLAGSGAEALSHVLRRDFALILLDVAMPGMDGFEVASIIKEREQSKYIPIIFITASVYDIEHILRGYTVGAVDYLRKPLDPHAMRTKVEVFVELHRQRRQLERQSAQIREVELREQRLLRAQAEAALRDSEILYQRTFEEAPIGIAHAGPDGRLFQVNQHLCDILGRRPADLAGRRPEELAVADETAALRERLALLQRGESAAYSGEHRLTDSEGKPLWVELTISALRDPAGGEVRRLVLIAREIGKRKQAELENSKTMRELQDRVRAWDEFLSLAAHELKTPITPLRLQAASLLRAAERVHLPPSVDEHLLRRLAAIDRTARRLEVFVDRLLDVSRLEAGAFGLDLEEVDLVALVHEVIDRMRFDAERAGSTIAVSDQRSIIGHWDRKLISNAVENLLANAIKYGAGRPIEVQLSNATDGVVLSVHDRGIGIPLEAQDGIFERFGRAEPPHHYGGFGLGLWMVRRIVEVHGGDVSVSSRPGEGSIFTVQLPVGDAAAPGRVSGGEGAYR